MEYEERNRELEFQFHMVQEGIHMDSPQFEHLTKALTRVISRRNMIKGLAATATGSALGLAGIGRTFALDGGSPVWQPVDTPPLLGTPINQLVIRILTGDDDLRGPDLLVSPYASQVSASVVIQSSK